MLLSVKIMLQMITVFFGNCGNFAPSEKIALQIFSRENLILTGKFKSLQKPLVFLFLLCLFPMGALAQSTVKGTVVDEAGEPIIGATVQVQGAKTGAITDFEGNFSVEAASNATLLISYVGYVTETVSVQGRNNIQVTLREDASTLNDVVVIGYGTMKKKLVTGATVQVKGEDIAKLNTTNALEAMQSSTPGVQITQSSAQPGKGYNVVIRGKGTNGNTAPLYVCSHLWCPCCQRCNPRYNKTR